MDDEQHKPQTKEPRRAWRATPDAVVAAVEDQARRFYAENRLERAMELSERLVRMRPETPRHWALLGVIKRRLDELVPALQFLQEAVELDPTNRNALVNLGECLVIAGKLEEGADVLRAVYEMGRDEEKAPDEEDVFTKRAGAQLAILQKVVES